MKSEYRLYLYATVGCGTGGQGLAHSLTLSLFAGRVCNVLTVTTASPGDKTTTTTRRCDAICSVSVLIFADAQRVLSCRMAPHSVQPCFTFIGMHECDRQTDRHGRTERPHQCIVVAIVHFFANESVT